MSTGRASPDIAERSPSATTIACPPFNDRNADLIIRSSNNIHFYVHKSLLSLCSSVFEGMFAIPNNTEQESHDNRPCVSVSDDDHHLGCLLSWCDPRCMRSITSMDDIQITLEMADKYGMDCIVNIVEKTILSPGTRELFKAEPFKLYAIAIRFRLEKLASEAAKQALRVPLASQQNCPEFKHISAFALQHLFDYHIRCAKRAQQCINKDDLQWITTRPDGSKFIFVDRTHRAYRAEDSGPHKNEPESLRSQHLHGAKFVGWWDTYMDKVCEMLNQTPYGLVAQNPSLLYDMEAVITSGSCNRWKERGYDELLEFSALLSAKIEAVLSRVPFPIEY